MTVHWLKVTAAGIAAAGVVGIGGSAATAATPRDGAVVRTDGGEVRGTVGTDHRTFQGIPYAAPPVGPLRWQSPQPASGWDGVRDATRPASACPQSAGLLGDAASVDEDCLYLNVTTPRRRAGGKLPVMVWVHGGGYYSGSGTLYGPERLAVEGGVVVVTLNYRLGVFGFLDHPSLGAGSGDYGLEDQQAALRWVHRNAAAFGGDANNVTLFGESAGGVSTCAQLASPAAAGLFQRAIIQSGPCALTTQWPYPEGNWVPRPRAAAAQQGTDLAARLGCQDPATAVACLRGKPVPALLDASDGGQGYGPAYGAGGVLPLSPAEALATGRFNRVPVIQGTTRDEHRMFVAALEVFTGQPVTAAGYPAEVEGVLGKDRAATVLSHYPLADYGSPSEALAAVWTDYSWSCTALATDRLLSAAVPTYAYEFADRTAPWAADMPAPSFPTGAFHASELQYLFDDAQFPGPATAEQRRLSSTMIRYWTRFARTGNPNGEGTPTWHRFDTGHQRVRSLGGASQAVDLDREHQCGLWRSVQN
jgi:para-nitrobenzyl esterase